MQNIKSDKAIMRILKIKELRHVLAHTSSGELCRCIRKDEDEYFFTLDAVPVSKEQNEELKKIYDFKE
jgi:5'(3')-deoxyribonucleotidase